MDKMIAVDESVTGLHLDAETTMELRHSLQNEGCNQFIHEDDHTGN